MFVYLLQKTRVNYKNKKLMTQLLLFLGFSILAAGTVILAEHYGKTDLKSTLGLFFFGILISIPFIMIEFMGSGLKYYMVISAFILIELGILYSERKIKYFHDLIHHNVKNLRILSFLLIGLGFTYSEISVTILHYHGDISELLNILPFKTAYALLAHTVLSSAASLTHIGSLLSETVFETVLKVVNYYSRIALISASHYLYVFSVEHNFVILIGTIIVAAMLSFFYYMDKLDRQEIA